jgi:hypothetical protein
MCFLTAFCDLSHHISQPDSSASGIRGATTSPLPQQAFISSDAAASTSYSTFPSSSTSTQSFEPAQFEQYTTPTSSTALAEFTPLSRTEAARKHVPRPMNCFMLYMQVQRQGKTSEEHENDFVKRMGAVWRGMAESEKDLWRRRAQVADLEHKRLYPDYKFQPKLPRKGKKGAKSAKGTTQPKMNRRKATIATTHAVAKPVSSSSLSQAQGLFTEEACEPETFPVASVAPTAQWDHSSSMYQQMLTSQTGTLSPLLEDVDTSASAWALPAMAQSLDFSVHPTPPMYSPYLRALGQDATFGDSSTRQAQTYSASAHNDLPLSVLSSLEFASDMDLNVPFQGYPSFLSATPLDMFYCSPYSPSSSYSGSSLPPPDFASDTLNPWPGQGSCVGSHLHLAEPQHHLFGSLDVNPPCPWPSSSWSG